MRVLIVEDEVVIAMHLAMLVAEFGHEVVGTVRSAPAAIAHAMALSPDIALMDVRLADGNGVDVAREFHTRRALRCIFVNAHGTTAREGAPWHRSFLQDSLPHNLTPSRG